MRRNLAYRFLKLAFKIDPGLSVIHNYDISDNGYFPLGDHSLISRNVIHGRQSFGGVSIGQKNEM